MQCVSCKNEIPNNLKACPFCGKSTNVNLEKRCSVCGAEITLHDNFCKSCGELTKRNKEQKNIERTDKIIKYSLVVGLVLFFIGMCSYVFFTMSLF